LLRKLFVRSSREREPLPPKRQETKSQSTKTNKPSRKPKIRLLKRPRRRLQVVRRSDVQLFKFHLKHLRYKHKEKRIAKNFNEH
jgi:hypothetical protein